MSSKFGAATLSEGNASKFGAATSVSEADFEREARDPSIGMNAGEAFLVGVGSGMTRMGQGLEALYNYATGDDAAYKAILAEQSESNRLIDPLKNRFPKSTGAGELTGEVVAGLPFGGVAGAGAKQVAGKLGAGAIGQALATGGAAGAAEGMIAGASEGSGLVGATVGGGVGAIAEAVLPPLFKLARKSLRGLTQAEFDANITIGEDGVPIPSDELVSALNRQGVDWDQLSEPVIRDIKSGNPEEAARLAMFQEQGIEPAAPSRITNAGRNLEDQQIENYLLTKAGDDTADELRAKFLAENQQVEQRFKEVASELGIPEEAGETVKSALLGQKSALASSRRNAYEELGALADEAGMNVPIHKQNLVDTLEIVDEYPLDDSVQRSINKLYKKYGLAPEELEVKPSPLGEIYGEVTPTTLTVANLEKFRQGVNRAFDGKLDNASKAARKTIIDAVDKELDTLADLEGSSTATARLRDQAVAARGLRRQEALEFEAKDIVADLIGSKPNTVTPLVDAAEVLPKLTSTRKMGEFNKMVSMLERGDDLSKAALGNTQAAVIMDILGRSINKSFRLGKEETSLISATFMEKAMDKFGRDKLKRLFKSNPEALRHLNQLERINKRRMSDQGAVQKGSLPVALVNNLWNSISSTASNPVVPSAIGKPIQAIMPDVATGKARKIAATIKPTKRELEDFLMFNSPMMTNIFSQAVKTTPAVSAAGSATERENR